MAKSIKDLREEKGYRSAREFAEALGIAQSTVSNRLRRGREKLRKLLEGRDQDA